MISRAINCERIDVSSFCCVSRATKGAPSTALISSGPASSLKRSTLNLQLSTSLKADYPIFSHCVEPKRGAAGRWGGDTAGRWRYPVRGVRHREAKTQSINPKNIDWPTLL